MAVSRSAWLMPLLPPAPPGPGRCAAAPLAGAEGPGWGRHTEAAQLHTHRGRQVQRLRQKRGRGSVPAPPAPKFAKQPRLVETEGRSLRAAGGVGRGEECAVNGQSSREQMWEQGSNSPSLASERANGVVQEVLLRRPWKRH